MSLANIAVFILGMIVASFVGVVSVRLHTGQSILSGRSRCDACAKPLSPLSLVPLVSYLASGGRARCCGTMLSPVSPLTELLLGALFVLAYQSIGPSLALVGMILSLSLLLLLVLYDLSHQILPPVLLIPFVCISALTGYALTQTLAAFFDIVLIALCIASSLLAIHVLSRGRAMGFADVPFVFGLALLMGPAAFPGFIFSFWIGAVIGIFILLKRPAGSRIGVEVPFAPFLAAGFLLAYFTQWNPFLFVTALSGR